MKSHIGRVLLPLFLIAIPVLTWVFVANPLVRGLVTGMVLGPAVLVAGLGLFTRRMRAKRGTQFSPPPIPLSSWDYGMSATSLDGAQLDFAQLSGQVLVLNFWATWCSPCIAEMPSLTRLAELTSDAGVALACITREPGPVVRKFLKKHPLDVPIYLLEGDPPQQFESAAIPATFVVDKHGQVAMQHRGAAAWDDPTVVNFVKGLAATPL